MSRSLKAHLLLLAITLIWGATFVVIKDSLSDVSPLLFNAIRMSLAFVVLAVAFHGELGKITRTTAAAGLLVGVLLCVGNEFQTEGLKYTAASKSAFVTGLSVVLVPIFLGLFWKRAINRWSMAGVALAFVGLYLVTVPAGLGLNFGSMNKGDLLTLVAAIVFAFHIIMIGHATQAHGWRQITLIQVLVSALIMSVAAPLAEHVHVTWSGRALFGIAITGFLSLALAFSVQAWAQQFTPPTHTALIFSLEPVFAWITSFLVLGERLGWRAGIGAVCIVGGVLVSEEKGSAESMAVSPDHAAVPAHPEPEPRIAVAARDN